MDLGTPDQPTPFHDLDAFSALPRLAGLRLSPDGHRLVTGVATPDAGPDGGAPRYVTALWEVDPTGARPARRLTRGQKGEGGARFTREGDLLFTATRPGAGEEDVPALWRLPAGGGEAEVVATRPGGISSVLTARDADVAVLTSPTLPTATDEESEKAARTARKDAGVRAILHDAYPVRYWDHDLGPAAARVLTTSTASGEESPAQARRWELRDVTGHIGHALGGEGLDGDLSPDGRTLVCTWVVPEEQGGRRSTLVSIDLVTGERTTLADRPDHEYGGPVLSPDGRSVAFADRLRGSTDAPHDSTVVVLDLLDPRAEPRPITTGWDRWATSIHWTPDGEQLLLTADQHGRGPVFAAAVDAGGVRQLTDDDFTYTDLQVAPDGRTAYALRSSYAAPAHPVRIDLTTGETTELRSPATAPELPGRLTEVRTTAEDGTEIRGWLALPHGASADAPAPLLLWIHGGPVSSWNAWSWRWCPWVMVARGYAVLMPDPALSTGYGRDFVGRGWGRWGDAPYTDLMAITDATERLPEIDPTRTAAMGGSFGGYMANWVAGHTDRFAAIVTHASLWALDGFGPTTDAAHFWRREMTPERQEANSPHHHADAITTPMLVIHGDKDYRVPIGEGIRLWWDLVSRSKEPDSAVPHRFLYFPDENHWILTPGHAKVWYDTVLAFVDHHVLGRPWRQPDLLG